MSRHFALAVLAVTLCHALLACQKPAEETQPPPLPVKVTPVVKRDLTPKVEITGTLEAVPGNDVKLAPLAQGRLVSVPVAEGDAVKEGQVVAAIDPAPLRDALAQAQAAVTDAEAAVRNDAEKLHRAEMLVNAGVSARQDADDARAQLAASQAKLKTAQASESIARREVARAELRAPFNGVVAHVFAAPGESVDPSKPVVEVARIEQLELRANIPAASLARLSKGQRAELLVEGADPVPGEVFALSPSVDPVTGAGVVRIRVTNPGTLRLGQLALARVALAVHPGVPAVPASALIRSDVTENGKATSRAAVTTVTKEGKTENVPVELGASDGEFVELRAGPPVGQLVVAGGGYAIPDGTTVSFDGGTEPTP
ncbi:efflux RND transporter periplasmic adaptor subunit [Vitiosangium sp. GDMCC 1.1324]|uniref:efflux RND transporter periplasmic adaptor subunit n=1 Tax=Vitiosangium sp. (strain GDMCC 1.1324) TaxID=2138576 RepID=UPI00130E023E|nr:efflux RND transporter periplasmic adaptor subunit [Vitiosangium sp. GDMCC 1.1324]